VNRGRALAWAFLLAATAMFIVRGPMRAAWWSDDFAVPYSASRALVFGTDPYQPDTLNRILLDAGREIGPDGRAANNSSVYLPPTLVPTVPFALLPWRAARIAWLCLNVVLVAWMIHAALSLAGLSWRDTRGLWLAGGIVALAPIHTGIAVGQIAIPSATLLLIAIALVQSGRQMPGGVALGISVLLKPQLTGPFLAYYFLRGGRRAALVATVVGVASTAISIGWLELNGVPWLESWRSVMSSIMVPGSQHDPAGPWSAQLLELRTLIAVTTGAESAATIGFLLAAAAGAWLYVAGRTLDRDHDLLLLSGVAVLSLLATYHRFYDAALLVIVLAAIASRASAPADPSRSLGMTPSAVVMLACLAVFFVPGAWAMQRLAVEGRLPAALTESWLWNALLLRHHNWALVLLFAVLAAAIARARRRGNPPSAEPR
jgi:hypothetical protein